MNDLSKKSKEEILKTPIKDLGLFFDDSEIFPAVKKLYSELDSVGIKFKPKVYLSDDWGCPDGVPVVGVPFYLADKILTEIETEKIGRIDSQDEIKQILRHEAGHAFNYAYSLYKLDRWKEIFGVYSKPYEDNFAPIIGSGKFVRHFEGWYAQMHPDEDFAETFAVLITPGFDWKSKYRGTKAYRKLAYAAQLIKEYKDKPAPLYKEELDVPVESMSVALNDWYKERISASKPEEKILILFYQEYPKQRPVHDEVVDQIKGVLLGANYQVFLLPVNRSIERITNGIKQERPDLIFNLCETFRDNDRFEFNMTALLEMIRIPFTGSSSGSIYLSHDKYVSKKIFDFHKIPYPDFHLAPINQEISINQNLNFPIIVKPVHEDASIGIDINSVVYDKDSLIEKVRYVHNEIKDDALIEEYIDGREFFVSILGNQIIRPLDIVELDFSKWPKDKPKIYTNKAKIETESEEYKSLNLKFPSDLSVEVKNKIYDLAIKAYKSFGASDYGRIDIRMNKEGKLYVLEGNLNPYLAKNNEMAIAAESSGLNYNQLIIKIVEAAIARNKI